MRTSKNNSIFFLYATAYLYQSPMQPSVLTVMLLILKDFCVLCVCLCVLPARSKSMVLGELSRISRPSSPLDQEKALKAGWLKRQRSIMKNWQLRWFVLRTEALYFYKDQDETKAQVALQNLKIHFSLSLVSSPTHIQVQLFHFPSGPGR